MQWIALHFHLMVCRKTILNNSVFIQFIQLCLCLTDPTASKPVETPLDRPNSKFLMLISGLQIGSNNYQDAPSNENNMDSLPLSPSSTSYRLLMSFLAGRLGDGGRWACSIYWLNPFILALLQRQRSSSSSGTSYRRWWLDDTSRFQFDCHQRKVRNTLDKIHHITI